MLCAGLSVVILKQADFLSTANGTNFKNDPIAYFSLMTRKDYRVVFSPNLIKWSKKDSCVLLFVFCILAVLLLHIKLCLAADLPKNQSFFIFFPFPSVSYYFLYTQFQI